MAEAGQASRPDMGRYVTVSFEAAPEGVACLVLDEDDRALGLRPIRSAEPMPVVGERVTCVGSLGSWTTTALSAREARLELATPRWRSRETGRSSPRVAREEKVTMETAAGVVAGRLKDVSSRGAAVLAERAVAPRTGEQLQLGVPGGTIEATVRSVRPHAHRLLVVLGLSFDQLDPAALRWVTRLVMTAGQARSPLGPLSGPEGAPRTG